jgi:hypothetical protein
VPGNDLKCASLDHIIPVSRGGKNEKSNLQFVTCIVNITKSDMTHCEFVDFCKSVSCKFLE